MLRSAAFYAARVASSRQIVSRGLSIPHPRIQQATSVPKEMLQLSSLPADLTKVATSPLFTGHLAVSRSSRGDLFSPPAIRSERLVQHGVTQFTPMTILPLNESQIVPEAEPETLEASSTLKKRRLKMNKHKYRKRRKRDRRRSK